MFQGREGDQEILEDMVILGQGECFFRREWGEVPSTSQGVRLIDIAVRGPDGGRHCTWKSRTEEKRSLE